MTFFEIMRAAPLDGLLGEPRDAISFPRLFDTPRSLRISLPHHQEDRRRLETALAASTKGDI